MENKKYFEDYTEEDFYELTFEEIEKIPIKDLKVSSINLNFPKGINTNINNVSGVFYTNNEIKDMKKWAKSSFDYFVKLYDGILKMEEVLYVGDLDKGDIKGIIKIKKQFCKDKNEFIEAYKFD